MHISTSESWAESVLQEYIGADWQERINTVKLGNELLTESYPPDIDISQ